MSIALSLLRQRTRYQVQLNICRNNPSRDQVISDLVAELEKIEAEILSMVPVDLLDQIQSIPGIVATQTK